MDIRVLIEAVAAGALFGGALALAYVWLRKNEPNARSHGWKIFVCLALIVASRHYFLNAP